MIPLRTIGTIAAIALLLFVSIGGYAQTSADASEVEALKQEVRRMKADIDTIKEHIGNIARSLQQREAFGSLVAAPQNAPNANPGQFRYPIAGYPSLGRPDAPVTVVEFSDFECPFCRRYFSSTFPDLKRSYIDTGKVRYVFVDFPLEQIHPRARKASEGAHCAGDQGKFWEMHDVLFANQKALEPAQLVQHARKLGLDAAAFESCLSSGKQSARINRGLGGGSSVGVTGTPTFLVAKSRPGEVAVGSTTIVGAQPIERFRQAIDDLLAGK